MLTMPSGVIYFFKDGTCFDTFFFVVVMAGTFNEWSHFKRSFFVLFCLCGAGMIDTFYALDEFKWLFDCLEGSGNVLLHPLTNVESNLFACDSVIEIWCVVLIFILHNKRKWFTTSSKSKNTHTYICEILSHPPTCIV